MNNLIFDDINLNMKQEKKDILKELIIKYLIKQITNENHS